MVGSAPLALVAVLASPPPATRVDPAQQSEANTTAHVPREDRRDDGGDPDAQPNAEGRASAEGGASAEGRASAEAPANASAPANAEAQPDGVERDAIPAPPAHAPASGSADSPIDPAALPPKGDAPHTPSRKRDAKSQDWPFLLALGVTGLQVPIVRTSVVRLDPRATGRATTMVGGAASLRWVPRANDEVRGGPWVGLDVGFRSGSVRFRDVTDAGDPAARDSTASAKVAHDVFAIETAALLYLAKSQFARLAVDAGGGGMVQLVRYDLPADDASQRFGSGFVRLGATVEVLVSRVAFVFDLRGYGVITDRRAVVGKGAAFSEAARATEGARARAPVATMQTMLVGSAGLAVRF